MKRLFAVLAFFMAATFAPTDAKALCIICSCSVTAPTLSFNTYSVSQSSPNYSSTDIQVACTGTAGLLMGYDIALGKGGGPSYASRQMSSGADTLGYNLYKDPAYLQVWGDGTGGSSIGSGFITLVLLGTVTSHNIVWGRIPAKQNVRPGSYSDTITVTVTY